jgi:hypothetical protein
LSCRTRKADEDHELAVFDRDPEVGDRARAVAVDLADRFERDAGHPVNLLGVLVYASPRRVTL